MRVDTWNNLSVAIAIESYIAVTREKDFTSKHISTLHKKIQSMSRISLSYILVAFLPCIGCDDSQKMSESSNPGNPAPIPAVESQTPASSSDVPVSPADVQLAGVYERTLENDDGRTIRYTISVPENYSDQTPSPLVVALHYGGTVTPFYGRGMIDGFVGVALEELNAIIVAPDAPVGDWTSPANETAVLQIMNSVIASYNVDSSRTLLTGYSLGGEGTWFIAGRHQDRFSAAIPMAGSPGTQMDWKIPLYVIHSRKDFILPLEPTQKYIDQLKKKDNDVELVIVEDASHFDSDGFVQPLSEAVPWIVNAWKQ